MTKQNPCPKCGKWGDWLDGYSGTNWKNCPTCKGKKVIEVEEEKLTGIPDFKGNLEDFTVWLKDLTGCEPTHGAVRSANKALEAHRQALEVVCPNGCGIKLALEEHEAAGFKFYCHSCNASTGWLPTKAEAAAAWKPRPKLKGPYRCTYPVRVPINQGGEVTFIINEGDKIWIEEQSE